MQPVKLTLLLLAVPLAFLAQTTSGQNSTPIVVQAATAATPSPIPPANPAAVASSGSIEAAIKALQQMKAANDEILKKQEATLQQLEEVKKGAEQLKIFSKRG